ncbi:MAG: SdrD B-like domain-containing protein [Anaerolineae bacterium]
MDAEQRAVVTPNTNAGRQAPLGRCSHQRTIANVTVTLKDGSGTTVGTTTTDGVGNYQFPNVTPGPYTVVETDPGFVSTTPNSVAVNAPAGGTAVANFGDQKAPTQGNGNVTGTVFNDLNGNGTQDPGEPGIPGVTVTLKDPSGNPVGTTTTDASGNYSFPNVPPGTYTVVETDPPGFVSTTPNSVPVVVTPNSTTNADFGDRQAPQPQKANVVGTVFEDINGNGTQEPGEPGIANVTVTLKDGSGTTVGTTTTDGVGNYQFPNVTPGPYTVVETDPAGFVSTTPNSVAVNAQPGDHDARDRCSNGTWHRRDGDVEGRGNVPRRLQLPDLETGS